MSLNLSLDRLPIEGTTIRGELDPAFLELGGATLAADRPAGYELQVQRLGDLLHVQGDIAVTLRAECGRCLQAFPLTLALDDHHLALDLPAGAQEVDLAPVLREDLLLELPAYPRCEDGDPLPDGSPRNCPAADRFERGESPVAPAAGAPAGAGAEAEPAPDPSERWKALDELGDLRQFPDPSPEKD